MDAGDLTLVAFDEAAVPGVRDRLRLLLACAARCDPFLPYPPGSRVPVTAAVAWPAPSDLESRMARAHGAAQVTVAVGARDAERRPGARSGNGRDWLMARAAVRAAEAEDDALRRAALASELAATGGRLLSERPRDRDCDFDCLVRRASADETLKRLAEAVRGCSAFARQTVRITGPWPVFALAPPVPR